MYIIYANVHTPSHIHTCTYTYIMYTHLTCMCVYCHYCVYILYVHMYICVCVCALMGCAIVTGRCAFFDAVICMPLTQHTGCGLKVLLHQEAVLVGSSTQKFFSGLPVR